LSGPISGLTYDDGNSWREHVTEHLEGPHIHCMNPMRSHEFLRTLGVIEDKHAQEDHHLGFLVSDEFIGVRDAWDTMKSDVCFVNLLGATRVSIGTVLEIGMAHAARVPVVLVMEKSGNLHDHAMIRNYASLRFDDLQKAIWATKALLAP
jgi:hypothetical protein